MYILYYINVVVQMSKVTKLYTHVHNKNRFKVVEFSVTFKSFYAAQVWHLLFNKQSFFFSFYLGIVCYVQL